MQAAGGIDNHEIGRARFGRLQSIEEHSRRIASRFGLNNVGAGAFAPDFQLLDGGGAEGIGGAQQD